MNARPHTAVLSAYGAVVLILATLTGCGTVGRTTIDVGAPSPNEILQDNRAEKDRITHKEKYSSGQIIHYGDEKIDPPPPKLLADWLGKRLSEPLKGKKVLLQEFSVEVEEPDAVVNEQTFNNVVRSTPGADPITAMMAHWLIGSVDKAKRAKLVDVRISGQVEGRSFSASANGSFKVRVTSEDLNSVITRGLDAAVLDVQRALSLEKDGPNQAPQSASPTITPPVGPEARQP